jgi:putative nucleotidyltransferase with HDIG domain
VESGQRVFFSIPTDSLMDNTTGLFDVYTLVDGDPVIAKPEDYVVYAKAPYQWTSRELSDLMKIGVENLFIKEAERPAWVRYQALKDVKKISVDESLEPRFRIRQIQDVAAHLVEACMLTPLDAVLVERLGDVAQGMVRCLEADPRVVVNIQTLGEYSLYTYIHSAGVSAIAPAICMKMGERDHDKLVQFSLAGLMHDIGKKHVPTAVLNKSGPLSPDEWRQMRDHPALGVRELQDLGFPKMVLDVVGLHHEKLDGSGYPNGLVGDAIPDCVQIVTVADIFSALTTSRCYHFKRNRYEALMLMKHDLSGKISKDAFRALVESLVVDPAEQN